MCKYPQKKKDKNVNTFYAYSMAQVRHDRCLHVGSLNFSADG